jgi:hypothetical protein
MPKILLDIPDVEKVLYQPKHSYTAEDIQAIADQLPKSHLWTYNSILQYLPKDLKISVEVIHNQLFIRG